MITRRRAVQAIGAAGAAVAAPGIVGAQELRKIRMGFGIRSVNPIVINILIGEGLGYNRQEGFSFTPAALGSNANVQIALDKGDIEFGVGTPSFQMPLFAKGELPPIVNYYEYTYPYKWDVAVKPESAIKSYEDLKGRKIGVSDPSTVKMEHIVDHIDHICQLAGNAKHCGIGSDLDGGFGKEQSPSDLNTIADLGRMADLLRQRSYAEADIEGIMHRNWVDFFRRAWGK